MAVSRGPHGATGPSSTGTLLPVEPMLMMRPPASLDFGDVGGQFGVGVVDDDNWSAGAYQR